MNTDVSSLFTASNSVVLVLYKKIINNVESFGKINIEPKKTSLHITNRSAFLGVHPKKDFLELNIVSDQPIKSSRITKTEQVSTHRFHNRIRLYFLDQIDTELLTWLKQAYLLMG